VSRFHVLRAETHFHRYRGRRVPFSYFARPNSFSAVPRASGPVFLFCAPEHVFGSTEGVRSNSHVLHSRTRFRRYQGRLLSFSCLAPPDSFSAVMRVSSPVFMFCAPGLVFDDAEVVPSRFHVFRSRTCFRRYRGRRVPFSCFALPDSFSAVPRASGPFFMFCAPRLVFGGTGCVGSRFHVLCSRTRFRWYRWCRVTFSSFALPDSFSSVSRASDPILTFCAPGLVFGCTRGIGSHFLILHARLVYGGSEGVPSHFQVFRPRAYFRR
jgi:hypothetical protein